MGNKKMGKVTAPHQRILDAHARKNSVMGERDVGDDPFLTLRALAEAALIMNAGPHRESAGNCMHSGIDLLESAATLYPAAAEIIFRGAMNILEGAQLAQAVTASEAATIQASQFKGLGQHLINKSEIQQHAKVVAKQLWLEDHSQEILIGSMADKVYRQLVTEGYIDILPETTDSIKDWIRSVAPDYATAPGRPKKPRKPLRTPPERTI